MSTEDEDVWAAVKKEAAKSGLDLKLVVFNDYLQPSETLENGELETNAFQHKPYLDNEIKTRGYLSYRSAIRRSGRSGSIRTGRRASPSCAKAP